MKQLIMALGCAALVAGCNSNITPKWLTVGPDYEEPEIVSVEAPLPDAGYPTTNKTETGEIAAADTQDDPRLEITGEMITSWWNRFDDPILTNMVTCAISNNLSFLMAQQRLEQARWTYVGSAAPLLPHISLDGSADKREYNRNTVSGAGTHKRYDAFKGGFDASWEIDIFGGKRRGMEAASDLMNAAAYSLADAWVSLSAEIGTRYIELRTVQQRIAVARTNLKLQHETYEILKSRLDSGIGDELAVNQAKYNVEQTRAIIPGLLNQAEVLMNILAILTGNTPGALQDMLSECPDRDWLEAPQKLSAIPMDLVRVRPDVKVAERKLAARVAYVGVSMANLYPKFFINGTLGLESVKIQKYFRRDSFYNAIGPSFSWPIFQGGNIIADIRVEESKMREAVFNYEYAVDVAIQEVRNAYSSYTQEYHRYQSLISAVKAAKDAEAISQDLYKNGLADFNNVLDAQRSLMTLEEALTISRGLITTDLIAIYKALGGGIVR